MLQVTKWLDNTPVNLDWLESEKNRITGVGARIRYKNKRVRAPVALFINMSGLSQKWKR